MNDQSVLLAHQLELEHLYNKNQTIPRIKEEFVNEGGEEFYQLLDDNEIPREFGLGVVVQMALHKRASIETLVGVMYNHLKNGQDTIDMLLKCADIDLIEYDTQLKMFTVIYEISSAVQSEIDLFQYPLPMVVEPRTISNNKTSGYFTHESSVLLRNNHHDDDVGLDHLNRLNQVRFTANLEVAHFIQNKWKNLDKAKEGESHDEFMSRKRAFLKYDKTAKSVLGLLMEHGDPFYLTHRYDKRGRTYCQGYHVSYQGAPWNKATIEFADKELVI